MKTLKIKLIYFAKFFADALFTPFLILYLESVGYKGIKLGVLMAIVPLFNILGNIFLSFFANNFKRNKLILTCLLFIYGISLLMLIFISKNYILTLIMTALISFANGPSFNLEEGISSLYVEKEKGNYSFTRIFGSLGYFVALTLIFFLPKNLDYKIIFIISASIFLILSIVWLLLKNLDEGKKEKASLKELCKSKEFIGYFLLYFIFFGAFNAFDYYIPKFVLATSFTQNDYSLFYALSVLVEAITIFVVGKFIKENNYKKMLYIAFTFILLRSMCFAFFDLPKRLIPFLVISRGLGWGSFLAIHVKYLSTFLNERLKATGILVLCVGQGIVASLLNLVGSSIIDNFSFKMFFSIIIIAMLLSICLYFIYQKRIRKLGEKND